MISDIVLLENKKIDKVKWDRIINESHFSNYALKSYFLDAIFPNWSAIVYKDYEVVFPLTVKSKFGIKYFITPIFIPFLGFSSSIKSISDVTDNILFELNKQAKYLNLFLDPFSSSFIKGNESYQRKCQVLDLNDNYEILYKSYSVNHKRNIAKAKKNRLEVKSSKDVKTLIQLFKDSKGKDLKELKKSNFEALTIALQETLIHNDGVLLECYNEKELICSAFFAVCGNRITYVKGFSDVNGRKLGAMHFIIDYVIKKNSDSNFIFDFGGSNNAQVAKFNYGFGSNDLFYKQIKQNSLPKIIKLLKN